MYFSGKEDTHEQRVGFLVHKDIVKSVRGCRLVSRRLMTVRLRARPFSTLPSFKYMHQHPASEVDEFYRELRSLVDQHQSRTFWLYKVTGTRKLEKMHKKIGEKFVDLSAIRRPMIEGSKSLISQPITP